MVSSGAIRGPQGPSYFDAIYPGIVQELTFTTAAVQSAAFNSKTTIVRIVSNRDLRIAFGANPTATPTSMYLPKETPEYFGVKPGEKVSILKDNGNAGFANITEGASLI